MEATTPGDTAKCLGMFARAVLTAWADPLNVATTSGLHRASGAAKRLVYLAQAHCPGHERSLAHLDVHIKPRLICLLNIAPRGALALGVVAGEGIDEPFERWS